jgi:hypothetical protein
MIFLLPMKVKVKKMSRPLHDSDAIPCMVLTFTDEELALVKETLEEAGYEDDLKQWVLDNMQEDDTEPGKYEGSADRVINNVSEFIRENPETVKRAGALVGGLLGKVIKKGPLK